MSFDDNKIFFSVAFELILVDTPLPYDLYVNSSAKIETDKFVRVFPKGDRLSGEDVKRFKKKYFQLYVLEGQRNDYLTSITLNEDVNDVQKGDVIKDSAIHYLIISLMKRKNLLLKFL